MNQLQPTEFKKVLALFDHDFPNRTLVLACLETELPCKVYVDSVHSPSSCIVVANFHNWTFIGGEPIPRWVDDTLDYLRLHQSILLISSTWINGGFKPSVTPALCIDRYEFLDSRLPEFANRSQAPAPLHFKLIDSAILERCEWKNEMMMAYGTAESFLQFGKGVCLMHGDDILCEAYAVFRAANCYELGVITPASHRKNGYASITCRYLTEECALSGHHTSWSCEQANTASIKTARKLDFGVQRKYQQLYFPKHKPNPALGRQNTEAEHNVFIQSSLA